MSVTLRTQVTQLLLLRLGELVPDADRHRQVFLLDLLLDEDVKARECFEEVCIVDITFRDIAEKMKKYSDSD